MSIFCLKCTILNTLVCIQGLQTIIKTLKRGKLKKKKKGRSWFTSFSGCTNLKIRPTRNWS